MFAAVQYWGHEPKFSAPKVGSAFHSALCPFSDFDKIEIENDAVSVTALFDCVECYETEEVKVHFWGQLTNRAQLLESLGCATNSKKNAAALVALAWDKWGEAFPSQLIGDFAIVIFFPQSGKVVLVRDAIGVRPLFYYNDAGSTICATTPKAILLASQTRLAKNEKWIARFLIDQFAVADSEETAYEYLFKVAPGRIVICERGKTTLNKQWKTWQNTPPLTRQRDQKWVTQHRAKFVDAVFKRAGSGIVGAESSAGIDSSSIIATLCDLISPKYQKDLVCFGYADTALTAQLIEELSAVKGDLETLTVRSDAREISSSVDENAIDLSIMGYPISHANYVSGEVLKSYRETRDLKVVLSGFGGDEVITSFAHQYVKELIDQRDFRTLYDIQSGGRVTKFLRCIRRLWFDFKEKRSASKIVTADPRDTSIYNPETIKRFELEDLVKGTERRDSRRRTINSEIIERELTDPNIANRLECHTIFGRAYGVQYRWPMLDEELIQNYLDTPSIEKYGPNGTTRYLHKRAMAGIVPDSINWRPNKVLGPHLYNEEMRQLGLTLLIKETQETLDNLHPDLMNFIQPVRIQELLNEFSQTRPNYEKIGSYTEAFCSLVSLNYWFHNGH
jgi:asparagine synthase (glutamine-hydrolysing)